MAPTNFKVFGVSVLNAGCNFENSENVGAPTHFRVFRVSCPTTGREAALKTLKLSETQTNFKVFRVSCPTPGRGATLNTRKMTGTPPISKLSELRCPEKRRHHLLIESFQRVLSYARPGPNFGNLFQSLRSGLRPWSGLEALNTLNLWGLQLFSFAEFRVLPPWPGCNFEHSEKGANPTIRIMSYNCPGGNSENSENGCNRNEFQSVQCLASHPWQGYTFENNNTAVTATNFEVFKVGSLPWSGLEAFKTWKWGVVPPERGLHEPSASSYVFVLRRRAFHIHDKVKAATAHRHCGLVRAVACFRLAYTACASNVH